MEFAADTPKRERVINGQLLSVPQPYVAGQTITEGEASALNQVLCENVSNNLRQKIKDGVTEGEGDSATTREYTDAEAQALVDEYLAKYEMGVRQVGSGSSRVVDPIEREARKLAKAKATEIVKAKGLKTKDVNMDEIAEVLFENNKDALLAEGKKIVAAAEKAKKATSELDVAGLSI